MPLYEFACRGCGSRAEVLRPPGSLPALVCASCGRAMQRLFSPVSLGGKVQLGPGRAAWPRTWRAVDGGDPEKLRYWRRRIEREMKEEDRNPELRARADAFVRRGGHDHGHGVGDADGAADGPAPEPYIGPGIGAGNQHPTSSGETAG